MPCEARPCCCCCAAPPKDSSCCPPPLSSSHSHRTLTPRLSRMGVHVLQLKRTREGNPNTASQCWASQALVSGSAAAQQGRREGEGLSRASVRCSA